jgi:hypothetical protein
MVVALIALFVALGTGAYAAINIPANSVGTAQLMNGAVTGSKIRNGTITGAKIRLGTLGDVPFASQAVHASAADNATRLGGSPASAFALTAQPGYTQGTLQPGYTNFGNGYAPAGYLTDTLGFVHLHGTMNCQSGTGVAFTLPAGDRPVTWLLSPIGVAPPGTTGRIDIAPNGNLWITSSAQAICGLDGITFLAGQ